jgi:PPM family protein phosphatase
MPAPSRRRRWLRIGAIVLTGLILIGGSVLLASQVYFLGTDDDGRVALYKGLPYELPLGINLYSEERSIGVQTASLSEERQQAVTEHELRSEEDAADLIDDIDQTEGAQPPTTPATPAPQSPKQNKANTAAKRKKKQKAAAGAP